MSTAQDKLELSLLVRCTEACNEIQHLKDELALMQEEVNIHYIPDVDTNTRFYLAQSIPFQTPR